MTGADITHLFARLNGMPGFREWLQHERDEAYKYLINASEPFAIHRAQGKLQLLEEAVRLLDRVRSLQ